MADTRIISGLTTASRVDIYPLRRKLFEIALAMQKQSGLTQYIETNSIWDPHREPTSDEILGFSDDGTIFGYIEVLDTLGPTDSTKKPDKLMDSTSFILKTLEFMATDIETTWAYPSLHTDTTSSSIPTKGSDH